MATNLKCSWCDREAVQGAFNMYLIPFDAKEDDPIPPDTISKLACRHHIGNLRLFAQQPDFDRKLAHA